MKITSRIILFIFFFAFLGLSFAKIAEASTLTLSGKVLDQSNAPIANTTITVTDSSTNSTVGTTTVDPSTGSYSLTVPQGTYNVTATPPSSSGFQSITFSNQSMSSDTILDFTLVPQLSVATLSGHITDPTGAGIGGLRLRFCTPSNCGINVPTATTDSTGFYSLQILSGTGYTLHMQGLYGFGIVSSDGAINIPQDTTVDLHIPTTHVTFQVQDSSQNSVAGVNIGGRLSNSSSFSVQTSTGAISFSVATDGNSFGVGTDTSGKAILTTFPVPLSYTVSPPNNTLLGTSGSQSISQDTTIPVTLAAAPAEHTLSGHITDSTGAGIGGLILRFCTPTECDTAVPSASTDSTGYYSTQLLSQTGYTLHILGLYGFGITSSDGAINIPGDTTVDMQVPTTHVTFQVQDSSQNPVAGAGIGVRLEGGFSMQTSTGAISFSVATDGNSGGTSTDSTGKAILTTFPVPLSYSVTPPNNTLLGTSGTQSITQDMTIPITLASAPVLRSISGQITDPTGTGISGLRLRFCATVAISSCVTTSTDGSGFYSAQLLSGTGYTLHTGIYGFGISSSNSAINIVQDTILDLHVPMTHVTFQVQDSSQNPVAGVGIIGRLGGGFAMQTSTGAISFSVDVDGNSFGVGTDSSGKAILITFPGSLSYTVIPPNNTLFLPFSSTLSVTQDLTQLISLQSSDNTLSGKIYTDDNQNGVQDTGEAGYQGATVTLSTGQTTTTDANGNYAFTNLLPGTYTETLTVPNGYFASTTNPATVPISANTTENFGIYSAPVVGTITAPNAPVQVNTAVSASARFTDGDTTDTHTASWNWGDGSSSTIGSVTEPSGAIPGLATGSHTYTAAGIYTITVTVVDNDGATGAAQYQYVTVYNPTSQGLFSGGQHYTSPAGAYTQNTNLTGIVKFGLSYKYQGTMPVGDKQFTMDFAAANFTFNATSVTSLVTTNNIGTLRGTGTV